MIDEYRVATDDELKDYNCDECYSLLVGPNGFECLLTEPEDRNWYRDGKKVIDELNRLYKIVQEYKLRGLPIKLKDTQFFTRD